MSRRIINLDTMTGRIVDDDDWEIVKRFGYDEADLDIGGDLVLDGDDYQRVIEELDPTDPIF